MSPPAKDGDSAAIGGQLAEADYVAAQFLHLRPRPVFAVAGILMLALAAGALWRHFTFTLLACLLLFGFHFGFWLPHRSRRLFRQYQALADPVAVEVRADGVFFRRPTGEGLLPWTHVRKWRHSRTLVLLYPADNVFHLVPRRFFPDPRAYGDFLATLEARVGRPV